MKKNIGKIFSVIFGAAGAACLVLRFLSDKTGEEALTSLIFWVFIWIFIALAVLAQALGDRKKSSIIVAVILVAAALGYGGWNVRNILLDRGAAYETVVLDDCTITKSSYLFLGSLCQLKGYDENGKYLSFEINESDYNRLHNSYRVTSKVIVNYYPHTGCVWSVN